MRPYALVVLVALACAPAVEVRTAAPSPIQNAIQLTNGLGQAVNVYVTFNGNDQFIQQVRASTAARLPVPGIPAGTTVTVKAVTVDGTRTFSKPNVVLNGTYTLTIP